MQQSDLITSSQAASVLGKSARTVQRMVEAGSLTAVHKLPGTTGAYLFRRTDVEALIAKDAA